MSIYKNTVDGGDVMHSKRGSSIMTCGMDIMPEKVF